jgi:hypothetical protein
MCLRNGTVKDDIRFPGVQSFFEIRVRQDMLKLEFLGLLFGAVSIDIDQRYDFDVVHLPARLEPRA